MVPLSLNMSILSMSLDMCHVSILMRQPIYVVLPLLTLLPVRRGCVAIRD
jgi:hypothetical protein